MRRGSRPRRRLWRSVQAVGLIGLVAAVASAYVPRPEIVARSAAQTNRKAERTQTLQIKVALKGEDGRTIAEGAVIASPEGRARLEVRSERNGVSRQLRRTGGLSAARNGQAQTAPVPVLPPFWLLQARDSGRLLSRLSELGGNPGAISMGYEGSSDCYVIGSKNGPSVWIDQDELSVVRIQLGGGLIYRLGPQKGFAGGIVLPSWVEMEAPGAPRLRLELQGAQPFEPSDTTFRPDWLIAGAR